MRFIHNTPCSELEVSRVRWMSKLLVQKLISSHSMFLACPIVTAHTRCPATSSTSLFTHPATTPATSYDTWPSPVQASPAAEYNNTEHGLPDGSLIQSFESLYYFPSNVYNVEDWQPQHLPVSNSSMSAISTRVPYRPITEQGGFPTPVNASPYSSSSSRPCTKVLVSSPILEFTSFVPYPTPPHESPIHTSGDDYRITMMNQLYGSSTSTSATRHYLAHYWTIFHQFFPIMHKPTFSEREAGPLLTSAMAAVGAQYSDEQSAAANARALHEHCVGFLEQVSGRHL